MTKARDLANAADVLDDVSATELSYVNGVTSAIQTQLNAKQAVVSGVDDTEIGYLNGVTSAIQTQIDSKIGSASAISPTLIDAKGDLIVGSAADTAARLAVGTNNHVLTADSSATNGVKWAAVAAGGGMTLLSTTTLSGTSTTISVSASSYLNLMIIGENIQYNGNDYGNIEFNGTANLVSSVFSNTYTAGTDTGPQNDVDLNITYAPAATGSNNNTLLLNIYNQSQTSTFKNFNLINSFIDSSSRRNHKQQSGQIRTTSAISQLKFYTTGAAFGGGTIKVYGVN